MKEAPVVALNFADKVNIQLHCIFASFFYFCNVLCRGIVFIPSLLYSIIKVIVKWFRFIFSGVLYFFSKKSRARQLVKEAEVLESADDIKGALNKFRFALSIYPKLEGINLSLGRCYLKDLSFDKALEHLKIALKKDPSSPEVYFYFGTIFYYQNNPKQALVYLEKSEKLFIEQKKKVLSVQINVIMADCYQLTGKFVESVKCVQRTFKFNPKGSEKLFAILGKAYAGMKQPTEALVAFKKALTFNANNFEVWNDVGELLLSQGDQSKALQCFNQALALNKEFDKAKINVESLMRMQK